VSLVLQKVKKMLSSYGEKVDVQTTLIQELEAQRRELAGALKVRPAGAARRACARTCACPAPVRACASRACVTRAERAGPGAEQE
jgi:hypothetical protein